MDIKDKGIESTIAHPFDWEVWVSGDIKIPQAIKSTYQKIKVSKNNVSTSNQPTVTSPLSTTQNENFSNEVNKKSGTIDYGISFKGERGRKKTAFIRFKNMKAAAAMGEELPELLRNISMKENKKFKKETN